MKAKKKAQCFRTVTDMLAVPPAKIDHFCEDLRLWLRMHAQAAEMRRELKAKFGDAVNLKVTSPTDAFGWIDDDKHDARIKIEFQEITESPQSDGAVAGQD